MGAGSVCMCVCVCVRAKAPPFCLNRSRFPSEALSQPSRLPPSPPLLWLAACWNEVDWATCNRRLSARPRGRCRRSILVLVLGGYARKGKPSSVLPGFLWRSVHSFPSASLFETTKIPLPYLQLVPPLFSSQNCCPPFISSFELMTPARYAPYTRWMRYLFASHSNSSRLFYSSCL